MNDLLNILILRHCYNIASRSIIQFYRIGMNDFQLSQTFNIIDIDRARSYAYNQLQGLNNRGIRAITYLDEPLRNYPDAPAIMFYSGDINLLSNYYTRVAVIGTRQITPEIMNAETCVVSQIARRVVTVSGLALGCDTTAHYQTIVNGGKTIAILPSTLSNIMPRSNYGLAQMIVNSGGLLITEYLNETSTDYERKGRYIERDKLQAMFSHGIIMSASKIDGGSRHAVGAAMGMNKPVCALNYPGVETLPQYGLNKYIFEQLRGSRLSSPADADMWVNWLIQYSRQQQLTIF